MILLQRSKNCKMQHITVICYYSCSVVTDTLVLYCIVNSLDMKLDRVSLFCHNIRCCLRVETQWNIQPILCLYLAVVTKRNTLMFSAWCQSKLLTADCFCIELSWDIELKASLAGRLWPNYEVLRLCTGDSMHIEPWNCMTVSPNAQFTRHSKN